MNDPMFSEWRALREERASFGKLLTAARKIKHPDLRRIALTQTWEGMDPVRLAHEVVWMYATPFDSKVSAALWVCDHSYWVATHELQPIANAETFDVAPTIHRWSVTKAKEILPVIEYHRMHSIPRDLATKYAQNARYAVETKESWLAGNVGPDDVERAAQSARRTYYDLRNTPGAQRSFAHQIAVLRAAAAMDTQRDSARQVAHAHHRINRGRSPSEEGEPYANEYTIDFATALLTDIKAAKILNPLEVYP